MIPTKTCAEFKSFVENVNIPGLTHNYSTDPCLCKNLGETVASGAVCAGRFRDARYMIPPGNCSNSSTPTCPGTNDSLLRPYDGLVNISAVEDVPVGTPEVGSTQTGNIATAAIVAEPSVSSGNAAHFCNDMSFGGYSDWFLPSKSELTYLFCHSNRSGNRTAGNPAETPACDGDFGGPTTSLTGFASAAYHSSTEISNSVQWILQFSNGSLGNNVNKFNSARPRCLRIVGDAACDALNRGDVAPGGAICAGTFRSVKYMTTPGNCTDSATPTCNGAVDAVTKAWDAVDISGVTNLASAALPAPQGGDLATAAVLADPSMTGSIAAKYCSDMVYAGYSDWYLPDKSELTYLYCNSNRSGTRTAGNPAEQPDCAGDFKGPTTLLTGFDGYYYISSTEGNATSAWVLLFSQGALSSTYKNLNGPLRCIRKY